MTLREFFARLPKDGWWISCEGEIRRGNDGIQDDGVCQCPVSSIGGLPTIYYLDVADAEGISRRMADMIAAAADDEPTIIPSMRRLRERLLSHCNLSSPNQSP